MKILLPIILCVLSGCASWKGSLVSKGTSNEAIRNAIEDFSKTEKSGQKDSVFSVSFKNIGNEIIGVSIFATNTKFPVFTKDKIKYDYKNLPSRFHQDKSRLFYWRDSTVAASSDLAQMLSKYRLIDTLATGDFHHTPIGDERKKAVDYYFCKSNLKNYRKTRTSVAMGWYKLPTIKCD